MSFVIFFLRNVTLIPSCNEPKQEQWVFFLIFKVQIMIRINLNEIKKNKALNNQFEEQS